MERWLSPAELRKRAGLTQKEVAAAIGRREQTISDWERGVKRPLLSPAETLILMRLYQASLDELVKAFDRIDPDEI
jgi:transcriptional regulator with XRE-family HTH domain